jgi:NitT/TauT family transport system ATP-binding protein
MSTTDVKRVAARADGEVLISAEHVTKAFPLPEGKGVFKVLDDVSVRVRAGEIVALLGRSGCGKSTLLRIMAGLIAPTDGRVLTNGGTPLRGPNPDVAMVFQSFALLPWLTVQDNVELGLEARGVPHVERHARSLKAIDMVGLDGFESAYPKELSGGMRQRVGFARAFVVEPKLLFMDEPFSALDVLTAENLRGEIDSLWNSGVFPARSVLIVTHNIEEAVLLADRVVILSANPGRVRGEIAVELSRPHDRTGERFKALVEHIYRVMTNPEIGVEEEAAEVHVSVAPGGKARSPYAQPLPHARAGGISGLLEIQIRQGETDSVVQLARRLRLDVDEMLPILDAAALLGFAEVAGGGVRLTEAGREFARADILRSKEIFREQVLARAPMVATVYQTLKEQGAMRADFFLDILDEHYPDEEAERQFGTLVDWGRYAELFEYDAQEKLLTLTSEEAAADREGVGAGAGRESGGTESK